MARTAARAALRLAAVLEADAFCRPELDYAPRDLALLMDLIYSTATLRYILLRRRLGACVSEPLHATVKNVGEAESAAACAGHTARYRPGADRSIRTAVTARAPRRSPFR